MLEIPSLNPSAPNKLCRIKNTPSHVHLWKQELWRAQVCTETVQNWLSLQFVQFPLPINLRKFRDIFFFFCLSTYDLEFYREFKFLKVESFFGKVIRFFSQYQSRQ